mmetsp:Transcript_3631/g.3068  ORF Transcript_3631/g.3068 Transcript_3631/m.3068 type:complete len:424 (+) Transcript_3631:221-1492(+)
MGNTYLKLEEKINTIYLDNLENLNREMAATLTVHQDISEKTLNKTKRLVEDILISSVTQGTDAEGNITYFITDYPIDWLRVSELHKDSVATVQDPKFGNLPVTYDYMTYILPNASDSFDSYTLRKLNTLNSIWSRINLIMIGQDSNINITRTFIMMQDITNPDTMEMLATIPGQQFEQNINTDEFLNFPWFKSALLDTDKLIKINMQADPFHGGLTKTTGFAKGFRVGNYQGAVGVMFSDEDIHNLLSLFFDNNEENLDEVKTSIAAYITNPVEEFLIEDQHELLNLSQIVEDLTGKATSEIYKNKIIHEEIEVTDEGYIIKAIPKREEELNIIRKLFVDELFNTEDDQEQKGKIYSLVAALIPNNINSTNLEDYDYLVILLEDQTGVNTFSQNLKIDIEHEFWILIFIIIGCSIFLSALIGL